MTDRIEREEKLESLIHRTLRDLPHRRAPATLVSRVFGELQRRAELPWWRRGFAQWSPATRFSFVIVSVAAMTLMLWNAPRPFEKLRLLSDLNSFAFSWVQPVMALGGSARQLSAVLANVIPAAWMYIALGVGAMFYVILFGLGAAAYRTLYLQPVNDR